MFCQKCGSECKEGALFCSNCGAPLVVQSESDNISKIPDHLAMSILTTLFCCIPFGIVSIVYAVKTGMSKEFGHVEKARFYSKKAFSWSIWGIIFGIAFVMLYGLVLSLTTHDPLC